MLVFKSVAQWCTQWEKLSQAGKKIAFVPTMGALHEGHLSLVKQAKAANDFVVVSIFVNPTQFDNKEDLAKYPNTLEQDQKLLESVHCDALFLPAYESLYADRYRYKISESELSLDLCGSKRPGHFDGVLTVVMKLFQIVRPAKAYFGEKDWQQSELVKGMVEAFFLPLEIVVGPTLREANGLAMSSRNVRLSIEERKLAPKFHELLASKKSLAQVQKELEGLGFRVDYLEEMSGRRLGAAFLGSVRLIDNVRC